MVESLGLQELLNPSWMGKALSSVLSLLASDAAHVFPVQLFRVTLGVIPILDICHFCVQDHVVQENDLVLGHRGHVDQVAVGPLLQCLEMAAVEGNEIVPCANSQQHETFIDFVSNTNGFNENLMQVRVKPFWFGFL